MGKTKLNLATDACLLLSASLVGTFVQGFDWVYGFNAAISGFKVASLGINASTLDPSVSTLLNRGGGFYSRWIYFTCI